MPYTADACLRSCQPKGSDDHECEHIGRSRDSASSVRAAVVDSVYTIEAVRLNCSGNTVIIQIYTFGS